MYRAELCGPCIIMDLKFTAKRFDELTVHELHDALKLREDIFVVEQACAYHEIDGRDPSALHVLGKDPANTLIAYARILPPENENDPPHIGRVVVHADHRGKGLAHRLIKLTLDELESTYGSGRAELAAQSHLEKFYSAYGFVRKSEEYMWDGI